jgi:Uma2 family endonuclease
MTEAAWRAGCRCRDTVASNNKKELKYKYEIYEESGAKEYWIVSPPEKNLMICTLTNGKYVVSPFLYAGDLAASSVLEGFSLDLKDMFENMD